MKISRRELVLLIVLILMILGYLFYQYVYVGQEMEIERLSAELEANKARLDTLRVKQDEWEKYAQNARKLDTDIRAVERMVPYIKDMPGTLVELYYMILERNLEGNQITFSDIIEGEKFNYFSITFAVRGKKANVDSFLRQLQDFKRKAEINSVTFAPAENDLFAVNIDMKVYVLKSSKPHEEPADYDFMEGRYGNFKDLYDMFKNTAKAQTAGQNPVK